MVPDDLVPAAIRTLMKYGPSAVMEAEWRDPDDSRPDARRHAREVKGHRVYDPLRWSRRRHKDASAFTEMHIHAADRLRRAYDVARLGGLPGTVWAGGATPTRQGRFQPQSGFPQSALAMAQAHREFRRVMTIFSAQERSVVVGVVLELLPISTWTRYIKMSGVATTVAKETQKLVRALDKLTSYFDAEIKEDMALGRVEA